MEIIQKISRSGQKIKVFWFILLFICLLPILSLIYKPGFWVSDDGEWMIIRLSAFYQEIRNGQFPVRWLGRLNHEYGYPVANFLYPGFLYLGSLINSLGFGIVNTVKILFVFGIVSLSFGTFLWLKKLFSHLAAFTGAVASVYSSYFLFDIFRRGSIGEVLSLSSVPFLLWAVEKKSVSIASFLFAWLIIAHNSLALIFVPIILLYSWLKNKKMTYKVTAFGLGISSFFWIPALTEESLVIFPHIVISDWTRYFVTGENYFLIGPLGTMMGLIAIFLIIFTSSRQSLVFLLLAMVSILALILSMPLSTFIWAFLPLPTLIQFPWRFLSVTVVTWPYFMALFISKMKPSYIRTIITGFVLTLSLVEFISYSHLERINKGDSYYDTNDSTTTVSDEYMPIWVKTPPRNRPDQKITSEKTAALITIRDLKSSRMKFSVETVAKDIMDVHTLYYPGWIIKLNNKVIHINPSETNGYINIPVNKGKTDFTIYFSETPRRLIADGISITSTIVLICLSFVKSWR